jgi:hypothetical protein
VDVGVGCMLWREARDVKIFAQREDSDGEDEVYCAVKSTITRR